MKIIISTGQGRLHLIESASVIKNAGVDVEVITGWVPSKHTPDWLLNFVGRFLGRINIAYGLRKRQPSNFTSNEIHTCSISEFFMQFLYIFTRLKLLKHEKVAVWGWKTFGWQSRSHIKNADIFHVRSGAGQGGAIKTAKSRGLKVVVDHSIAHPVEAFNQLTKAYRGGDMVSISPESKFWQLVLKDCLEADRILVNSEYVKDSFVDNGFRSKDIDVIHLGIRKDFIGLKKTYANTNTIKLIFTGGFGRRKGAHLIVETVRKLIEMNYKFNFQIIGSIVNDFDPPDWFRKHPDVRLTGFIPQDELKSYLENSDLYVFPSYCEGSAQSVKEAMAVGLPVIATRESGCPISHGINGWIIPVDSSKSLLKAIVHLGEDGSLRERLGRSASRTILKDHSWEQYAEKTLALYGQLLDSSHEH